MKNTILILSFFFMSASTGAINAQEIDFGTYFNYSATLSDLSPGTGLDFGTLVASSGVTSLVLSEAKVLTLEGVKYLDVFVTITADDELLLNGNPACVGNPTCSIDFTLEAAYANRGANNIGQATVITAGINNKTALFPILQRTSGPAGPPPTPVYEGYNPALFNETAYIYVYGSINIGAVNAGDYTSNITVSVSYD